MAEIIANMLRMRALQFGAAAFFAAVLVTNVDVKSLLVGEAPPIATQTSPPPIHITTMPPPSTLFIQTTDTVKASEYERTTSFLNSSAVKRIYVLDYILDQPSVKTPRPEASAEPPRRPFQTDFIRMRSSTVTSTPLRPLRTEQNTTSKGNSDDRSYSADQSSPKVHWILTSIQGVLTVIQEHILAMFPGMAPPLGLIAFFQIRYMQYLQKITTAENFQLIELKLASQTITKDRRINEMQTELEKLEQFSDRAINLAEAAVAAAEVSLSGAASEITRLRSMIEEGEQALTKEQVESQKKLGNAAEDTARLLQAKQSLLEKEKETSSKALQKAKDKGARLLKDKSSMLEKEKEESSKALQKAKDDGAREARRLTDLAIQKNAETAERRKADKATIDDLKRQSATDAEKIRQLSGQVRSIAQKDETIATLKAGMRELTEEVGGLKKDQEKALKNKIDVGAANLATIAQLNAQVTEANNLREVATVDASEQKALAASAAKQRKIAEERALQQETRATKAEEICKAAEEKASREEANAAEAAEQLKARDQKIATFRADSQSSIRYLRSSLDTAQQVEADLDALLTEARAEAQMAKAQAKKTQKALQERTAELQWHLQKNSVWPDPPAPNSNSSAQEEPNLPQPKPLVPLTSPNVPPKVPWRSGKQPLPRCMPPANGKTKTPPEERGLPANTPTGPKARRPAGEN